MTKRKSGWFIAVALAIVIASGLVGVVFTQGPGGTVTLSSPNIHTENPYLVRTFIDEEGRQIDEVVFPGRPPAIKAEIASVPEPNVQMGINTLPNVPAFEWSYGCSPTSAAMLMGYYDRIGYANMYTGPTNGGVCPTDNSIWGPGIGGSAGECPLSATHEGIDGRATYGHVDDYWIAVDSTDPDPFIGNWPEHTHGDCTADFMGTNQYLFDHADGGTTFYYYLDGSPLYDYTGCEPDKRDGCHGLRLFAESRGYTVITNFSQYIKGQGFNPNLGFTFNDYKSEIDAGRPVLIHTAEHTMFGFGYDTAGSIVYLHDTWDHSDHTMTWGGTYAGYQHESVTVIQLESTAPPTPTPTPSTTPTPTPTPTPMQTPTPTTTPTPSPTPTPSGVHTWRLYAAGFFPKHLPDSYNRQVVLAGLNLATIPDEVQGVWWYDGPAQRYRFWVPGVGGDLTILTGQFYNYMVLVTGACEWEIPLP